MSILFGRIGYRVRSGQDALAEPGLVIGRPEAFPYRRLGGSIFLAGGVVDLDEPSWFSGPTE